MYCDYVIRTHRQIVLYQEHAHADNMQLTCFAKKRLNKCSYSNVFMNGVFEDQDTQISG